MNARAAALGIGYQLWLRSRWPLLATAALISLLVAMLHLKISPQAAMVIALAGTMPLVFTAAFLIVGVMGANGDLSSLESGFPRHMMVLPLTSRALALAPLLYGIGALALLWIILSGVVLPLAGLHPPVVWPALVLAAVTAWLQATSWMPVWIPFARVAACIGSVFAIITFTIIARALGWGDPLLYAGLLVATGLGIQMAVVSVARARRGDGTVAPWAGLHPGRMSLVSRGRPFRSPQSAQLWFELRRNCTILPILVLPVALLWLLPALGTGNGRPVYVAGQVIDPAPLLLCILVLVPVFIAGLVGTNLGKPDAWSANLMLPSFLSVRPMDEKTLIAAKMKASALTVAITFGVLFVLLVAALLLPRRSGAGESFSRSFVLHLTLRRELAAVCGLGLLILFTWLGMMKSFALTLYGRKWLTGATPFVRLALLGGAIALGWWAWLHPSLRPAVLEGTRVLMWMLVVAKIVAAPLIFHALRRAGIVAGGQLVAWTALWLAAAALMVGAMLWLVPAARASAFAWTLAVVLFLPFNRLIAMPLALHHNRHR